MAGLSAGGGCGAGRGGGLRWLAEGRGIDGIALIWTFRLGFNKKKIQVCHRMHSGRVPTMMGCVQIFFKKFRCGFCSSDMFFAMSEARPHLMHIRHESGKLIAASVLHRVNRSTPFICWRMSAN